MVTFRPDETTCVHVCFGLVFVRSVLFCSVLFCSCVTCLQPGPDLDPSDPSGTSDYSDGYWTGSASLPRIGQRQNVALILYRPPPKVYAQKDLRAASFPFGYTHAGAYSRNF
eukprot:SAG22_NODE_4876_length_1144_cov_1.330144_1_plen_112_part_10